MKKEITKKIKKLKSEIIYEKKKLNCCCSGKSDFLYLHALENEMIALEYQLKKAD